MLHTIISILAGLIIPFLIALILKKEQLATTIATLCGALVGWDQRGLYQSAGSTVINTIVWIIIWAIIYTIVFKISMKIINSILSK